MAYSGKFSELNPKGIDVIILCGGLGKRLRAIVNDRPKPMALVAGYPFLDLLIAYVAKFGFKRFILCIGYKRFFFKKYYQKKKDLQIVFSEEREPLGTGGAIKNAKSFIKSPLFLVLNGDSFFKVNLKKFFNFHFRKNALVSIVVKKDKRTNGCGVVSLNSSKQITSFIENPNG